MKRRLSSLFLALSLLLSLPVNAQEEKTAPSDKPLFQTVYATVSGKAVSFNSDDFQLLCRQATGHDLKSLSFSDLPPRLGTFWYRPEDKQLQLTPGIDLFPYEKPTLSQTVYRPSAKFTGQAEIPFVMTSVKKETVEGTLFLYVSPESKPAPVPKCDLGEEHTTVKVGQAVSLEDLFPFSSPTWPQQEVRTTSGGHVVTSVTFSLPPSEEGSLWLDHGGSDARKLLPDEALFSDGMSNFYALTFVPAQKEAGEVHLEYAVASDTKKALTGTLTLHFVENKTPGKPSAPSPDPEPAPVRFSDMAGWEWAAPAAELLASRFALRLGPEDTLFRPGDQATRMEVLHTLVETAFPNNFDPGIPSFSDLPQDPQYARTASFAFAQGLALGDGTGQLDPDGPITRQDALVLLHRALLKQGRTLPAAGDLSRFTDQDSLAPYAREAAGVLLAAGILQGDDASQLQPQSPITRAEMAVLICRAFPG